MAKIPNRRGKGNEGNADGDSDKSKYAEWFHSLSAEQRREFLAHLDQAELERWRNEGDRPRTGDSVRDIVADSTGRRARARALGVPPDLDLGHIARRAKVEQAEERYQRGTLNALRRKARGCAAKLLDAVSQLVEAEKKRPEEEDHRRRMASYPLFAARRDDLAQTAPSPEGPLTDEAIEERRGARAKVLHLMARPECMESLLPWLIAILDANMKPSAGPGQPKKLEYRRVEGELQKLRMGDARRAEVLVSQGMDGGGGDGKARERQRRRRMQADKGGRNRTRKK